MPARKPMGSNATMPEDSNEERETDDGPTEISTALNFIVGSIEYYYQRGIADEENRNALRETFADFHKLDAIIRERAQPDQLVDWEKLIAFVREQEQVFMEIESSRESEEPKG
jgi:hypothetical protein